MKHFFTFSKNSKKLLKNIYDTYARYLFGVCYRYVGNEFDAQNALNDGFMRVYNKLGSFEYRSDNELKAWLTRIMINESLKIIKSRDKNLTCFNENLPESFAGQDTDHALIQEDYHTIIAKLPAGYRTIINLNTIEGYSHAEIANMLKISESTSRSQLTKARKALSKLIKEETL